MQHRKLLVCSSSRAKGQATVIMSKWIKWTTSTVSRKNLCGADVKDEVNLILWTPAMQPGDSNKGLLTGGLPHPSSKRLSWLHLRAQVVLRDPILLIVTWFLVLGSWFWGARSFGPRRTALGSTWRRLLTGSKGTEPIYRSWLSEARLNKKEHSLELQLQLQSAGFKWWVNNGRLCGIKNRLENRAAPKRFETQRRQSDRHKAARLPGGPDFDDTGIRADPQMVYFLRSCPLIGHRFGLGCRQEPEQMLAGG
jgi:hypothetical protein